MDTRENLSGLQTQEEEFYKEENAMKEVDRLKMLREPFAQNLISKLPKGTKAQNECSPNEKINCKICGGWHHPKVIHLDYVGHAALTDRLLDVDPHWTWEPLALDATGLPVIDKEGGLWIKLTMCGITRLGYGDAQGKTGGNAMKERIGDALRNAAMRFGAALDLWHKGDLHADEVDKETGEIKPEPLPQAMFDKHKEKWLASIAQGRKTAEAVIAWVDAQGNGLLTDPQKLELRACTPKVDDEFVKDMEREENANA